MEEGWERGKQTYLKFLDDSVVVKAVDGVKNGADDGDGVMLSGLSLCEDAVKGFSAAGKLKREVVFCARLEALRDRRCC